MGWSDLSSERCPIARSVSVLGDRWTLLVVRQALLGARRFEDYRRALRISPTLLNQRLKTLCQHGILERNADPSRPRRPRYRLTRKGLDLTPALLALMEWGERHYPDGRGSEYALVHTRCGCEFSPRALTRCSACDEPVALPELRVRLRDAPSPDPVVTLPPSPGDPE